LRIPPPGQGLRCRRSFAALFSRSDGETRLRFPMPGKLLHVRTLHIRWGKPNTNWVVQTQVHSRGATQMGVLHKTINAAGEGGAARNLIHEMCFGGVACLLPRCRALRLKGCHTSGYSNLSSSEHPASQLSRKEKAKPRSISSSDQITKSHNLDILCGYMQNEVQGKENRLIFERIRAEHSTTYFL
jgi:hypothetical protein